MSWLKDERLRLQLTQEEVADKLEISRPTYNSLEADPDKMRVIQLRQLQAIGFDTSLVPDLEMDAVACPACDGTGILYKVDRSFR